MKGGENKSLTQAFIFMSLQDRTQQRWHWHRSILSTDAIDAKYICVWHIHLVCSAFTFKHYCIFEGYHTFEYFSFWSPKGLTKILTFNNITGRQKNSSTGQVLCMQEDQVKLQVLHGPLTRCNTQPDTEIDPDHCQGMPTAKQNKAKQL